MRRIVFQSARELQRDLELLVAILRFLGQEEQPEFFRQLFEFVAQMEYVDDQGLNLSHDFVERSFGAMEAEQCLRRDRDENGQVEAESGPDLLIDGESCVHAPAGRISSSRTACR